MAPGPPTPDHPAPWRIDPRWKVLYLLVISVAALAVPRPAKPYAVPALILLQVALLLSLRVAIGELIGMTARLRSLFLVLGTCYLLLPAPAGDRVCRLPLGPPGWALRLNLTGLGAATLMCGQVFAMVLASSLVRRSGSGTDLVEGLRRLRCPRLLCYSIDTTLALLGDFDRRRPRRGLGLGRRRGGGRGGGDGRGRDHREAPAATAGPAPPGFLAMASRLARGDAGHLIESIRSGIDRAAERGRATIAGADRADAGLVHDVAVISGIALMMASLKLLKVLPGIPFAPGHKSAILIPLYILAAQLTHSRFGATTAGALMGLIGQFQGDSQYGVFSVLKQVGPGLVIDLLWPVARRLPRRVWVYSILGVIVALGRLATEFTVGWILGARWQVYLFLGPRVVSNLVAGVVSGAVTYAMLPAFRVLEPGQPGPSVRAEAAEEPGPAQGRPMI